MNNQLIELIISNLTDDLLKKEYIVVSNKNKFTGHCYVASECYYHLSNKYHKVFHIKHENTIHWFLKDENDKIIDITSGQFQTPVNYEKATRGFFLTKNPSKRTQILISRIKNKLNGN